VSLSVAVALAQIGEFSFILATVGRDLGVLGDSGANTLVAASIISISLNPLLYKLIGPVESRFMHTRIWQMLEARSKPHIPQGTEAIPGNVPVSRDRAIVVGYGPTGKTLARLLGENEIDPVIVEMNLHTVRHLQNAGVTAIYGDASLQETLKEAGVETAVALILTSAGMQGSEEVIRESRNLNPKLRIIVRSAYLRDIPALRRAGADAVFSGEGEIALNMTEHMLRILGATDEQIDRERERVRTELSSGPTTDKTPVA
jgi:CPA2 family monovalent cation:H+ antiporter-2